MTLIPISHFSSPIEVFTPLVERIFPNSKPVLSSWEWSLLEKQSLFQYYVCKEFDIFEGITGHYVDSNKAYIGWFGVDPSKRQYGAGAAILEETEKIISRFGFDEVNLWCLANEESYPAHRLYLKTGYKICDTGEADGNKVIYFRKKLK